MSGSFAKPSVKVNDATITALSNVVLSFSTKPKAAPSPAKQNDENCTVFYEGVVKHPAPLAPVSSTPSGE
jgi:AsmA protein